MIGAQCLRLVTTGRFHATPAPNERTRCGAVGTPREFRFRVAAYAAPSALDADGFLVDWRVIHGYFRDRYTGAATLPSCERIAITACNDIQHMLAPRCDRLDVTVGQADAPAGMTAQWMRDNSITPAKEGEAAH